MPAKKPIASKPIKSAKQPTERNVKEKKLNKTNEIKPKTKANIKSKFITLKEVKKLIGKQYKNKDLHLALTTLSSELKLQLILMNHRISTLENALQLTDTKPKSRSESGLKEKNTDNIAKPATSSSKGSLDMDSFNQSLYLAKEDLTRLYRVVDSLNYDDDIHNEHSSKQSHTPLPASSSTKQPPTLTRSITRLPKPLEAKVKAAAEITNQAYDITTTDQIQIQESTQSLLLWTNRATTALQLITHELESINRYPHSSSEARAHSSTGSGKGGHRGRSEKYNYDDSEAEEEELA